MMKKIIKLISALLVCQQIISLPLIAADLGAFNLNIPNINSLNAVNDVSASEQSSPNVINELVMESPIEAKSYILGPGDIIAIHLLVDNSDLAVDHNLAVGADGNVFFPNIGAVYLSGLNLEQAKQKLDNSIRQNYDQSYKLYVLLNQPKKVKIYLSGMVKRPGPLAVYDNSRVSEVIGLSGGIVSGGSNRYVYIKRRDEAGQEKIITADLFAAYRSRDLSKDVRIRAGDVIEVPSSDNVLVSQMAASTGDDKLLFEGKESFVYVYGEVARSGRFEFVPGKRLSDYISYAGGPTGKALLGQTKVTRQGSRQIWVNASDVIYNGNLKNDLEIQAGDVIYVPGNFFYVPDFTSFANTILLGLTLYNTIMIRR